MLGLGLKIGSQKAALEYFEEVKAILGSSILGYWPLWESGGSTAQDIKNAKHGTYGGTVTKGQTGIGDGKTSVLFSSNGLVNVGAGNPFNMAEGFVSMWVAMDYTKYQDPNIYYLAYLSSDSTHGIFMRNPENFISFYRRVGSNLPAVNINVPQTSRWVHYCFCWSVAQQKVWAYVNGVLLKPATDGTLEAMTNTLVNPTISASANGWPGRIAHVVIGSALPTDDQIWRISRSSKQVIFDGDSRSNYKGWPEIAMESAFSGGEICFGGRGLGVWAYSGATVQGLITNAPARVDTVVKSGVQNILVVWAGVNSVATGAAQIYADLKTYIAGRRAAVYDKIILCSEIDAQSNMDWHNTIWPALNALLNADHSFADGFADLGADARLQNALDTTYFNADKIHLTPAGYAVVASIVAPVIASLG